MLRTSSFMRHRVDLLVKTADTDAHHAPVETYAVAATVPANVKHVSENRSSLFGRYEYPVDRIISLDPHPAAAVGNRVGFGGNVYSVLGVDDTKRMWQLHVAKIVR